MPARCSISLLALLSTKVQILTPEEPRQVQVLEAEALISACQMFYHDRTLPGISSLLKYTAYGLLWSWLKNIAWLEYLTLGTKISNCRAVFSGDTDYVAKKAKLDGCDNMDQC